MGFLYLGLAPAVFGNSLGKWLFTLKIVGSKGQPIRPAGWLARLLATGLWPVNAMMVLWSTTRRHLGDRMAGSMVVMAEPKRNLLLAMLTAAILLVLGLRVGGAAMKLGILRSGVGCCTRAPGQAAAERDSGDLPRGLPRRPTLPSSTPRWERAIAA